MTAFFKRRENVAFERKPKKARRRRLIKATSIFIFLMLAYPVIQFCIMWFGVNINSILLTFQVVSRNKLVWVKPNDIFYNYITIFQDFKNPVFQNMYLASFAYLILNCLITLPVSLLFAYFIFKKIYAAGTFKVIFYLPCILPIVALTTVYSLAFENQGFMTTFLATMGIDTSVFFIGSNAKWMVWIFCFWTGIGYNVMLLTAAMSRIPKDLLESAKMDGVGAFREFFYVIIPLTWPTITTLFIFGMMGFFGTFIQPMLLTAGNPETITIGLQIFYESVSVGKNHPATMGLVCTLIGTPIILAVRATLNHFFKEVNF